MNFIVAFLFILINLISVVSLIYSWIKHKESIVVLSLLVYILTISILGAFAIISNNEVKAIEIYRGNTTLQITYQDSIPIDSIVVYKNK